MRRILVAATVCKNIIIGHLAVVTTLIATLQVEQKDSVIPLQ